MKRKLAIIYGVMIIGAAVLAGCGQTAEKKTEEKVSAAVNDTKVKEDDTKDTFIVGMECSYAPFNWSQNDDSNGAVAIDGTGEFAGGYDVEIAKKVAEGLGKKLVIEKTEWDGLVPALVSGKLDAIIGGMSPTAERKKTIDFSDNYYKSKYVIVVKKGGAYESAKALSDFTGAKITAQLNTFDYTVIDQIPGVKKQEPMDNFPAMRVALQSGIIDGYVTERPEAVSATAANENFAMVDFEKGFEIPDDQIAIAVGLQKGSPMKDKINEIVDSISEDERMAIMDEAIKNQPAAQ